MNYVDYQDYVLRSLWRSGDEELAADLPTLIKSAEARIARDIKTHDLQTSFEFVGVTSGEIQLPADVNEIVDLIVAGYPPSILTTIQQVMRNRLADVSNIRPGLYYAAAGDKLLLAGEPNPQAPVNVLAYYYAKPAPYSDDLPAPYRDIHPDFFDAAVFIQTYVYLRDYDTAQVHEGRYASILDSMALSNARAVYPGGAVQLPLPGIVF